MKRTLLLALVLSGWAAAAPAADWPSWRGPGQNGVSLERDLPDTFSLKGQNLVWQAPLGGITTPIALNGRVFVITRTAGEGGSRSAFLYASLEDFSAAGALNEIAVSGRNR